MFDTIKSIRTSSSVLDIKVIAEQIVLISNQYLALILDRHNFSLLYKKQISHDYIAKHLYDKSFAISSELDFFITSPNTSESGKSFLLKYTDALVKTDSIQTTKKAVYSSVFGNLSNILAIGGEDGRVVLYSLLKKNILKTFVPRSDYISNLSFSKDDMYLHISSFDKKNTIYSFSRAEDIRDFQTSDVIEKSFFLDDNSKLILLGRDKKCSVYDIKNKTLRQENFEFDEWPTSVISINPRYFVVGTRGETLYIIDYERNAVSAKLPLNNKGVVSLEINEGHLFVGFVDGEMKVIDINSNLEKFILNLKLKQFAEASMLIETNAFLITHESASLFDEAWSEVLSSAKQLILADALEEAKKIATPFFFDAQKVDDFSFCLGNIEIYEQFSKYIEVKNVLEAFKLADKFPFLKNNQKYDGIEKYFVELFHDAKLLFAKGDLQSQNEAKTMLRKYTNIPSKATIINNLFSKFDIFLSADQLIKQRDFKTYFMLVQQNKFLEEEEIYKRVLLIADQTMLKLYAYEQENEYEKAMNVGTYLLDFLPYKESVEKKIELMHKKTAILKNIQSKSVREVYEFVVRESELEFFSPFIVFHQDFFMLKEKATEAAQKGDGVTVTKILKDYLDVEYTLAHLAEVYQALYLAQLEEKMRFGSYGEMNWEKSFEEYIAYFGKNEAFFNLCERNNFTQTIEKTSAVNSINGYKTLAFKPSVMVFNS